MRRERGERGGVGDRKVVSLKRSDKKAERKLYILVGCRCPMFETQLKTAKNSKYPKLPVSTKKVL